MGKLQSAGVILDRIKHVYQLKSDKKLAEFLQVKAGTVSAWRSRKSLNYDLILQKCSKIDLNWLFYNHSDSEQIKQQDIIIDESKYKSNGYYSIPPLLKLKPNGNTEENITNLTTDIKVMLPNQFIRNELNSDPGNIYYFINRGDTMLPLLKNDDIVVLNVTYNKPIEGGLYVVKIGEVFSCRRLQLIPENRIQITCDNKAYSSFTVDKDRSDFEVIGKVIWLSRKL